MTSRSRRSKVDVSEWGDLTWRSLKGALKRRGLLAAVGAERPTSKAERREHDNQAIVGLGNWERQWKNCPEQRWSAAAETLGDEELDAALTAAGLERAQQPDGTMEEPSKSKERLATLQIKLRREDLARKLASTKRDENVDESEESDETEDPLESDEEEEMGTTQPVPNGTESTLETALEAEDGANSEEAAEGAEMPPNSGEVIDDDDLYEVSNEEEEQWWAKENALVNLIKEMAQCEAPSAEEREAQMLRMMLKSQGKDAEQQTEEGNRLTQPRVEKVNPATQQDHLGKEAAAARKLKSKTEKRKTAEDIPSESLQQNLLLTHQADGTVVKPADLVWLGAVLGVHMLVDKTTPGMFPLVGLSEQDGIQLLQFTEYVNCLASCSKQSAPSYLTTRKHDGLLQVRTGKFLEDCFKANDWEQAFELAKLMSLSDCQKMTAEAGGFPIIIMNEKGNHLDEVWINQLPKVRNSTGIDLHVQGPLPPPTQGASNQTPVKDMQGNPSPILKVGPKRTKRELWGLDSGKDQEKDDEVSSGDHEGEEAEQSPEEYWSTLGGGGDNNEKAPIRANFSDEFETEAVRKAKVLREAIRNSMAGPTAALMKLTKLEPLSVDHSIIPATGEKLDIGLTEPEKFDILSRSINPSGNKSEVRRLCILCTHDALQLLATTQPGIDLTDPQVIKDNAVYAPNSDEKRCGICAGHKGLGQPFACNPWHPSKCTLCDTLVILKGELALTCPSCEGSWLIPREVKQRPERASKALLKDMDSQALRYVRSFGGESAILGSTTESNMATLKMLNEMHAMGTDRTYLLTERHAVYGIKAKFGDTSDGASGLVVRDFQEADIEGDADPRKSRDLKIPTISDVDNLEKVLETSKFKTAPGWQDTQSRSLQSNAFRAAQLNQCQFFCDCMGADYEVDTKKLLEEMQKKVSGIFAKMAYPERRREQEWNLVFFYWSTRIRQQISDLSIDRRHEVEKAAGLCIRLYYSPLLPPIVGQITLPAMGMRERAAIEDLYEVTGGTMLSGITDEKKKKKKANKSATGRTSTHTPADTDEGLNQEIELKQGVMLGLRHVDVKPIMECLPCNPEGRKICPYFQTPAGCLHGPLECDMAHEYTSRWGTEWNRAFLDSGGASHIPPLTVKDILPILDEDAPVPEDFEAEALQDWAISQLSYRLEYCRRPNVLKHPIGPIQSGQTRNMKWGILRSDSCPIDLFSDNGVKLVEIAHNTVGGVNAYFDGIARDGGDKIRLLQGKAVNGCCIPISLAITLLPKKNGYHEQLPGSNLPLEVLRQIVEKLLEAEVETWAPDSMERDIWIKSSFVNEGKGVAEKIMHILKLDALRNVNVGVFSVPKDDSERAEVFLYPKGNTREKPMNSDRDGYNFHTWKWGDAAINSTFASILTAPQDNDQARHAVSFEIDRKARSWNDLMLKAFKVAENASDQIMIEVGSTGRESKTSSGSSGELHSDELVSERKGQLRKFLAYLKKYSLPPQENPWWEFGKRADEKLEEKTAMAEGFTPSCQETQYMAVDTQYMTRVYDWADPENTRRATQAEMKPSSSLSSIKEDEEKPPANKKVRFAGGGISLPKPLSILPAAKRKVFKSEKEAEESARALAAVFAKGGITLPKPRSILPAPREKVLNAEKEAEESAIALAAVWHQEEKEVLKAEKKAEKKAEESAIALAAVWHQEEKERRLKEARDDISGMSLARRLTQEAIEAAKTMKHTAVDEMTEDDLNEAKEVVASILGEIDWNGPLDHCKEARKFIAEVAQNLRVKDVPLCTEKRQLAQYFTASSTIMAAMWNKISDGDDCESEEFLELVNCYGSEVGDTCEQRAKEFKKFAWLIDFNKTSFEDLCPDIAIAFHATKDSMRKRAGTKQDSPSSPSVPEKSRRKPKKSEKSATSKMKNRDRTKLSEERAKAAKEEKEKKERIAREEIEEAHRTAVENRVAEGKRKTEKPLCEWYGKPTIDDECRKSLEIYQQTVREEVERCDTSDVDSLVESVKKITSVANEWLKKEDEKTTTDKGWNGLMKMVTAIREKEYSGEAGEGTRVKDIPKSLLKGLPEGHRERVLEELRFGNDDAFLGPSEGYLGGDRPDAELAIVQILGGHLKSIARWRTIPFDSSELEAQELLVRLGIRGHPTGATEKLNEVKELRYDEHGLVMMRPLADCTDMGGWPEDRKMSKKQHKAKHPWPFNSGVRSTNVSRQLTTDLSSVACALMREKVFNPHHLILVQKRDVSGAFNWNPEHLRQIGGKATKVREFVFVPLTGIFGPETGPGGYEPRGSAPQAALLSVPWDSGRTGGGGRVIDESLPKRKNPEVVDRNGLLRTRVPPFVDDHLNMVANRGRRLQLQDQSVDEAFTAFIGPGWTNATKDEWSGGWSGIDHGYGFLVNTIKLEFSAPWSRTMRVEKLLLEYVNTPGAQLEGVLVPKIAGLLNYILNLKPVWNMLLKGRLCKILSYTARECGNEKCQPGYYPPVALDGESEEQGQTMLRLLTGILLRMMRIERGKLLTVTVEQALPWWYRRCCPGREKPSDFNFSHQDASGEGYIYFDDKNGKHIKGWYTEKERGAIFDFDREDHGIVVSNLEFAGPAKGLALCSIYNDSKVEILMNDNDEDVAALNNGKNMNYKNLECMLFICLWATSCGRDVMARYTNTKLNVLADAGSRSDLKEEYAEEVRKWEARRGMKAELVEEPEELRDMTFWVEESDGTDVKARTEAVFKKFLFLLDYYKERELDKKLVLEYQTLKQMITDTLDNKQLEPSPPFDFDIPESFGPSEERLKLAPPGGKRHVDTRASLLKQSKGSPRRKQSLREKASKICTEQGKIFVGLDEHDVSNVLMQAQWEEKLILWKENPKYQEGKELRLLGQTVQPIWTNLEDKVRMAIFHAGQDSLGKAGEDSGGAEVKIGAEWQRELRDYNRKKSPQATWLEENEAIDSKKLTDERVELSTAAPTCVTFAVGGNRDGRDCKSGLGLQYEEMGPLIAGAYGGAGVPMHIQECVRGVHNQGKDGSASAHTRFIESMPNHFNSTIVVRAEEVVSPLTGETARVVHERSYSFSFRKDICEDGQAPELKIPLCEPMQTMSDCLDTELEARGWYIMPEVDLMDCEHKSKAGGYKKRLAFVGSIRDPTPGQGEGAFPNDIIDPRSALGRVTTAAGSGWGLDSIAGHTIVRQFSNIEEARKYLLRDLKTEWLQPNSELGRYIIANAIPANVGDAVICAMLKWYLTPGKSGLSPRAKFERSEQKRLGGPQDRKPVTKVSKGPTTVFEEGSKRAKAAMRKAATLQPPIKAPTFKPHSGKPQHILEVLGIKKDFVRRSEATKAGPGRKPRPKPVLTEGVQAQIDEKITQTRREAYVKKTVERKNGAINHYLDFREAAGLEELTTDPYAMEAQAANIRYLAYEQAVHGLKGKTVRGKATAVDKYHADHGLQEPFKTPLVQGHIDKMIVQDKQAVPKLPVPAQVVELQRTVHGTEDFDELIMTSAQSTALWWVMRSCEYLATSKKKINPKAIKWEDVGFQDEEGKPLQGVEVKKTRAIRMSMVSTKNAFGRCTRTLKIRDDYDTCPVKLLVELYLRIHTVEGKFPDPKTPVYRKADKTYLTRDDMTKRLRSLIESCGIDSRLVASHSLRRGGACVWAATGLVSDEELMRWGRWNSSAYKLYVFAHSDMMANAMKTAGKGVPKFELN